MPVIVTIENLQINLPRSSRKTGIMAALGIATVLILLLTYTHGDTLSPSELLSSPGNLMMTSLAVFALVFMLWFALRTPHAIILNAFDRTITLKFLIPILAPANRQSLFTEWAAVHSCLYSSEHSTDVVLLLRAADGKCLELASQAAITAPPKGFWDVFSVEYFEPDEIRDLRLRVAFLTGLKDWGFSQKQLYDPSWKKAS